MHENDWQSHLQQQYDGRFYERLQETWGNEWSTRLDIVLQGNNDTGLIEQIRNESYTLQVGNKRYELSNHLGNVLAVVSDKKEQSDGAAWSAIVVSAQDYFPFGMAMPGRSTTSTYKYGFNEQEKDVEIGAGIYTAEFWQYDARLGRRYNLDPKPDVSISFYACFGNNPIHFSDPLGDTLRGISAISAQRLHNEMHSTFLTSKFKPLRELFQLEKLSSRSKKKVLKKQSRV